MIMWKMKDFEKNWKDFFKKVCTQNRKKYAHKTTATKTDLTYKKSTLTISYILANDSINVGKCRHKTSKNFNFFLANPSIFFI